KQILANKRAEEAKQSLEEKKQAEAQKDSEVIQDWARNRPGEKNGLGFKEKLTLRYRGTRALADDIKAKKAINEQLETRGKNGGKDELSAYEKLKSAVFGSKSVAEEIKGENEDTERKKTARQHVKEYGKDIS